jgi:hypothetical protein
MASEEWVTQAQAWQLPRDYGASPDEIEREIARDYRSATDHSAGHELGKAITDASASAVEQAVVAAYGAANPPPDEELAGALHDELADALDQARARLAAGDVPEVDRPAHEAQIELLEAQLAGDEAIPGQLARGGGDPVLAGKTAAWLAAEAAATQRWIAAEATRQQETAVGVAPSATEQEEITRACERGYYDSYLTGDPDPYPGNTIQQPPDAEPPGQARAADAVAGVHQVVADTQRLHSQRAERGPAAHWLAADDHAGTVGDEVELGSHDQALPPTGVR